MSSPRKSLTMVGIVARGVGHGAGTVDAVEVGMPGAWGSMSGHFPLVVDVQKG